PPVAPAVIVALIVVIATTAIPHTLVVANRARAQDSEGSVGVPAGLLDNDVATGVVGAALVDRVVVGAPSNLAPDAVHRAVAIVTAIVSTVGAVGAVATKDDVADGAGRVRVLAVVVAIPLHGTGVD